MTVIEERATAEKNATDFKKIPNDRNKLQTPKKKEFTFEDFEQKVIKIQRQARVMLNCKRFRVHFYRLVLLKSILEAKIHKEKMQMLFAFEQLIINTEDPDDSEYGDE